MHLTDELERLQALHDSGTLTETEFADAKAKVLTDAGPQAATDGGAVQRELNRLQLQSDLLRLDQDWSVEREDYLLRGRYGAHTVPTVGSSIGGAIFLCLLCLVFIVMGTAIPQGGAFTVIGSLGIAFAIPASLYTYVKANTYNAAYDAYQQKRTALNDQLAALGG